MANNGTTDAEEKMEQSVETQDDNIASTRNAGTNDAINKQVTIINYNQCMHVHALVIN